jgi:cell filamentation protein
VIDPYFYPGTDILKNKLGIRDKDELDRMERRLVTQRARDGVPSGRFDLAHLRTVHHHLFQDVYDWAGEIRTVELSKDGQQFQFRRFIETGMADVYERLMAANFLKGCSRADFADQAARIVGDVNYVHPFREGNGRTQLFYLEQLAEQAGHPLDLTKLAPKRWIEASQHSHAGDYAAMAREISQAYERQS